MEQVLSSPRGHSDWEQDQNSIGYLLLDTRDPDLHGDNKEDGERKLDFSEDEQGIVPLTLGEIFQENALNLDNLFQTCRYSGVEDVLSWEKGLECAAPEWQHQACNPQELAGEVVPGASGVSPGDVTDSGISSRESEEVCLQNLSPPSLPGFTDATPPSEKSTRGMESGNPPGLIEELPQDAENTPSQTSDLELKNTPSQTSDLELTNTPAQKEAPQTIELVQCTDLEQECLSPDPHTSSLSGELWPHSMNPQPLGTQIPQTHVSDRNWELHQSSPSQMMDLLQSESEELLGLGKALSPLKVSVRTSHSDSEPSAKPSSYSPSSSSLVALTPGDSISLVVSKELPHPLLDGYSISPWTGEAVTLVPIAEGEGSFLEHLSDRLSGSSAAPVTSTEISSGSTRENAPEQTTIPTATDEVIPHGPSLDVDVKSIPDPEARLETAGDVEPAVSPDSRLDIPSTDIIQTALPALPSEEHSSPDDSPETTHSAPECDVGASLNALEMDLAEDKHLTTGPCLSPHTLYSVPSLVELCEAVRDSACAQSNCLLSADTSLVDLLNSHNPESIPPTEGLAAPVHQLSCPITDTLADASESFGTRREAITLSDDSSPHMHSEAVNKESSPADWEGDKERGTRPQITLAIAPDSDQTSEGSALESGNTVLKHFVLDGCSDSIDLNNSLSERSESVYEKTLPVDSNEELTSASPAPADNQTEGVCFHSQVTSLSAREPSLSGTSPFTCGASQVTLVGVPETAQTHTPSVELSRESNSNSHPQVDLHQVTHTQVDLHQVPHTQIDLHMVTHIQADLHQVPHTQVDIQREKLAPTVEELQQVEVPQVEVPQADNTVVHLWQVTQRDVSVAQGGEFEEQDASPGGVSSQEELPVAVTMDPGVCTGVPGPVEVALDVCGGPDCELTGTLPLTMVSTETHPDEEQSPLRAVFQALDQDGDGFVRIEEFMEFATAYGADQLKDLTRFLDPSGLGVISFEDFHRGISAINSGGSDPELYKLELSSSDANGAAEEYDEQAEVSDSAYLGSESAYSECETFTDEDSGALVHPELHEDVETDSGIENTLTEHEETRNRFSLGSDLHGHALVAVIGGEEEHFEDFGESNTSDLLLANQEEGRAVPEGTEGEPEPHTHPGSPLHRPQMLLSPSPGDFPASLQTFLQTEALEFFCTHCHKQISRLEDLSTRLHLLEMNSSSKRLSSKKAARHLLQASVLEGMGDLAHDVLDLDSDITDKVLLLERRVCELEQDSVVSEEQHARLRQENLALVHRANALEEQLKEQELLGDESLQTLARKHRDASAKLQRERDLEIENLQARLHQLDEENSELRSCVPCLRANIERLEEEKRKLQDEVEDVTERLNEELDSRRKMADKLSHERHSNQKEKESTQELIEDLRKQLEHLQLFKLETEARRGRSPSAGLQEYNTRTREHELEQEIRRLKQDNRSLKEQNDELNGQIINLSIQGAKNLVSASFSESLAAEINSVSRSELMEAIHKQEEINYRLQDYIDRIIVAIMESNPSILEVK